MRENFSHGRPHILLRSSWQTVNIGDIGHTPGLLALLRREFPEAMVTLWPCSHDRRVRGILREAFPDLKFVGGQIATDGRPDTEELAAAFAGADFLLHGSGPSLVALSDLEAWRRITGKPYGIYGVSLDATGQEDGRLLAGGTIAELRRVVARLPADTLDSRQRSIIDGADFLFLRETLSLDYVRGQHTTCGEIGFGPDAAFAITLRDEKRATVFLTANGLEDGGFLSVIPRLRYTPYHLIHGTAPSELALRRHGESLRHKGRDLGKLRDVICRWVRATRRRVLLCAEMTYQVDLGGEIWAALPPDVRPHVVWREDYWMPGEAISVFARARALLSMDNHSPIFALAQGTPSIYLRQPTDTVKGQMWPDLGLGDWFLEIEEVSAGTIFEHLAVIDHDPAAARRRVAVLQKNIQTHQITAISRAVQHMRSTGAVTAPLSFAAENF